MTFLRCSLRYFKAVSLLSIAVLTILTGQTKTYYVDAVNGNDQNNGLSVQAPWQSLEKVNSVTLLPGDKLLFKSGSSWQGSLFPRGSGSAGNPILISKYGGFEPPVIAGNGKVKNVLSLFNQEYWIISDLEITNAVTTPDTVLRRGIYVKAQDVGTIHHLIFRNLYIHDVHGDITNKDGGGIFVEVTGSAKPTNFDSLIVEQCRIVDVDRTGFSNQSSWSTRTFTTSTNWFPNTNLIIRNNWFERTGGNGVIFRVSTKPLFEQNILKQCGLKTSGNAVFPFNCDDALIQYNEAYETVYNPGDNDASGFDADYRCKRTIIQYNYSHDNDGGFLVVTCEGGVGRFNDGTIVRYNISQNDGRRNGEIIHLSGQITNTLIHNNTIYSGASNVYRYAIDHASWNSAYPDKTVYYNNIFYLLRRGSYAFTSSTNTTFDYNVFYSPSGQSGEPADAHKITADPKFVQGGSAGIGMTTVQGYKLQPGSPCLDAGFMVPDHGQKDFWGNSVPNPGGKVDRGAHEFQPATQLQQEHKLNPEAFQLQQNYPNPFNPDTSIQFVIPFPQAVTLTVYDVQGKKIRVLLDGLSAGGRHMVAWNSQDDRGTLVASGMYIARLVTAEQVSSMKMILSR